MADANSSSVSTPDSVQLCEVFDLVRRVGGRRCILRLIFRLLLFFAPAAVMSDRGSRRGSHDEPAAP